MKSKARAKEESEEDELEQVKSYLGTATLRALFNTLDQDNNHAVDISELRKLLKKYGMNISNKNSSAMVDEADTDADGQISFDEFVAIMIEAEHLQSSKLWKKGYDRLVASLENNEDEEEEDVAERIAKAVVSRSSNLNSKKTMAKYKGDRKKVIAAALARPWSEVANNIPRVNTCCGSRIAKDIEMDPSINILGMLYHVSWTPVFLLFAVGCLICFTASPTETTGTVEIFWSTYQTTETNYDSAFSQIIFGGWLLLVAIVWSGTISQENKRIKDFTHFLNLSDVNPEKATIRDYMNDSLVQRRLQQRGVDEIKQGQRMLALQAFANSRR